MHPAPARAHQIHLRLTATQHQRLRSAARSLQLPVSAAAGVLIDEAIEARRLKNAMPPADPEELQLHLLVAVEQLIALMESIHPKGPGIAKQMMAQALEAARDRVAPRDEQAQPSEGTT